jgi:hypothetical protein
MRAFVADDDPCPGRPAGQTEQAVGSATSAPSRVWPSAFCAGDQAAGSAPMAARFASLIDQPIEYCTRRPVVFWAVSQSSTAWVAAALSPRMSS